MSRRHTVSVWRGEAVWYAMAAALGVAVIGGVVYLVKSKPAASNTSGGCMCGNNGGAVALRIVN